MTTTLLLLNSLTACWRPSCPGRMAQSATRMSPFLRNRSLPAALAQRRRRRLRLRPPIPQGLQPPVILWYRILSRRINNENCKPLYRCKLLVIRLVMTRVPRVVCLKTLAWILHVLDHACNVNDKSRANPPDQKHCYALGKSDCSRAGLYAAA